MRHTADFETRVAGIPCGVVIDSYHYQPRFKGSPQLCDSDVDYYGYETIEWFLVDRKGYPAKWLEKKLTESIREDIEDEIHWWKKEEAEEFDLENAVNGGY
jgi:hypothetical protein